MTAQHVPVLLERVVELIGIGVEAARTAGLTPVVVDGTLGMGGHAEAVLSAFDDVHLVGIDRDQQAIDIATRRLAPFAERIDIVHAVDDELPELLTDLGIESISAILLDLGVSSLQLDEDDRGFSYSRPAPLDMRMDRTQELTAAEVLATYSEADLRRILREYGEEKLAAACGGFHYEIPCQLGKRVPRRYLYHGKPVGALSWLDGEYEGFAPEAGSIGRR